MATWYVDVNGNRITRSSQVTHLNNTTYGLFAKYEDDVRFVQARWQGDVKDGDASPQEYWQPFEVTYRNIIREEKLVGIVQHLRPRDPNLTTRHATVEGMMKEYRSVVSSMAKIPLEEVIETEFDEVVGYKGVVPKSHAAEEIAKQLEVERIAQMDKPSSYEDAGAW